MDEMNQNGFTPNPNQQQQFYNQPPQQPIMNGQYQNYGQGGYNPNYNNYNQPKKSNKTCLIVGIVVPVVLFMLFIVGIIILIFAVGKERDSITATEFKTFMEDKEYIMLDATNQVSGAAYVERVYLAMDLQDGYQIEFYQFEDEEQAEDFYENNRKLFEVDEDDANFHSSLQGSNYARYSLIVDGKYKKISYIGDTAIYLDIDKDNQEEAENVLDELGY